jgi:hypothetical protein
MTDFDVLMLSAEDFSKLETWELQQALQQITGYMAVENSKMRDASGAHHSYLGAKEQFANLKVMASTIQTQLRVSAQLGA